MQTDLKSGRSNERREAIVRLQDSLKTKGITGQGHSVVRRLTRMIRSPRSGVRTVGITNGQSIAVGGMLGPNESRAIGNSLRKGIRTAIPFGRNTKSGRAVLSPTDIIRNVNYRTSRRGASTGRNRIVKYIPKMRHRSISGDMLKLVTSGHVGNAVSGIGSMMQTVRNTVKGTVRNVWKHIGGKVSGRRTETKNVHSKGRVDGRRHPQKVVNAGVRKYGNTIQGRIIKGNVKQASAGQNIVRGTQSVDLRPKYKSGPFIGVSSRGISDRGMTSIASSNRRLSPLAFSRGIGMPANIKNGLTVNDSGSAGKYVPSTKREQLDGTGSVRNVPKRRYSAQSTMQSKFGRREQQPLPVSSGMRSSIRHIIGGIPSGLSNVDKSVIVENGRRILIHTSGNDLTSNERQLTPSYFQPVRVIDVPVEGGLEHMDIENIIGLASQIASMKLANYMLSPLSGQNGTPQLSQFLIDSELDILPEIIISHQPEVSQKIKQDMSAQQVTQPESNVSVPRTVKHEVALSPSTYGTPVVVRSGGNIQFSNVNQSGDRISNIQITGSDQSGIGTGSAPTTGNGNAQRGSPVTDKPKIVTGSVDIQGLLEEVEFDFEEMIITEKSTKAPSTKATPKIGIIPTTTAANSVLVV